MIGIRRTGGAFDSTPTPETELRTGDVLIAIGLANELHSLETLLRADLIDKDAV